MVHDIATRRIAAIDDDGDREIERSRDVSRCFEIEEIEEIEDTGDIRYQIRDARHVLPAGQGVRGV